MAGKCRPSSFPQSSIRYRCFVLSVSSLCVRGMIREWCGGCTIQSLCIIILSSWQWLVPVFLHVWSRQTVGSKVLFLPFPEPDFFTEKETGIWSTSLLEEKKKGRKYTLWGVHDNDCYLDIGISFSSPGCLRKSNGPGNEQNLSIITSLHHHHHFPRVSHSSRPDSDSVPGRDLMPL